VRRKPGKSDCRGLSLGRPLQYLCWVDPLDEWRWPLIALMRLYLGDWHWKFWCPSRCSCAGGASRAGDTAKRMLGLYAQIFSAPSSR
jgi:hypothetical protein